VTGLVVRSRQLSLRLDLRVTLVCAVLLVVIAGLGVLAMLTGEFPITAGEVVRALGGRGDPATEYIVLTLRLPRLLTGVLVGAALGVSGAIFQSLSRNPLGSPDIIGFNQGAAVGALLAILLLGGGPLRTAAGAIIGGLVTAAAVYLLSLRNGIEGYRLVLVGIGVGAILESTTAYLLIEADLDDAMRATGWLIGSLNGRGWEHVVPVAAALVVILPAALFLGRQLRVLELGDEAAKALGVPVEPVRLGLIALAVAFTGIAVASAGPIAFVALAAPQLAQRLTRSAGTSLLPAALMGSLLLVSGDVVAQRTLGGQLPVGVVTGTIGGVYLAWLLVHNWRARA
jgi:iron complex transport system permease protein